MFWVISGLDYFSVSGKYREVLSESTIFIGKNRGAFKRIQPKIARQRKLHGSDFRARNRIDARKFGDSDDSVITKFAVGTNELIP